MSEDRVTELQALGYAVFALSALIRAALSCPAWPLDLQGAGRTSSDYFGDSGGRCRIGSYPRSPLCVEHFR